MQPLAVVVEGSQSRRVDERHLGHLDEHLHRLGFDALLERALDQRGRRHVDLAADAQEEGALSELLTVGIDR